MPKILVVDDSALMRRLLTNLLTEAGYQVAVARNGAEGVQQLTEWHPDVVTLDINMPEMDGLTALSLMMQARPTPVVMVSSLTEQGAQATFEALALGAVDFIAKPGGTISLTVEDIADTLDRHPAIARRAPAPDAAGRLHLRQAGAGGRSTLAGGKLHRRSFAAGRLSLAGAGVPAHARQLHRCVRAAHGCAVRINVRECNATLPLEPGHAYIGRGGTDMVVVERLGRLAVQPRPEAPGHPWHPSVDVLVDSAMKLLPARRSWACCSPAWATTAPTRWPG